MARNIVICCDGTGNEIGEHQSNVLKLYRVLKKDATQIVYYDPGLGTMGADNEWGRLKQGTEKVAGLAFGYGLDKFVLDAYNFLASNFKEGDRIFLFGFSRGAYAVRVLAGFINCIGILDENQSNLAGYAFVAYKKIVEGGNFGPVRIFEQALRPQRPPIRFLGLWDTVSSVIVPRRDRMYLPSLRQLAYTQRNPSIQTVRHALAIDERRRMFRPFLWSEGEQYFGGPFKGKSAVPQDVRQVWFAGVHSDIGGGYAEEESGLSKISLKWMVDECPEELKWVRQSVNQIVCGKDRKGSSYEYLEPNPEGEMHESLRRLWWAVEWLPKRTKYREDPSRKSLLGHYFPNAEARRIPPGAEIHSSVKERLTRVPQYRPMNLPQG
ncbi:MAG: DUF2235 domain-containing protein [Gammaproteobacteria bacterium]|nr:DUF2235 domain-containing protein [Gammaproteobacteria bacterium]